MQSLLGEWARCGGRAVQSDMQLWPNEALRVSLPQLVFSAAVSEEGHEDGIWVTETYIDIEHNVTSGALENFEG